MRVSEQEFQPFHIATTNCLTVVTPEKFSDTLLPHRLSLRHRWPEIVTVLFESDAEMGGVCNVTVHNTKVEEFSAVGHNNNLAIRTYSSHTVEQTFLEHC